MIIHSTETLHIETVHFHGLVQAFKSKHIVFFSYLVCEYRLFSLPHTFFCNHSREDIYAPCNFLACKLNISDAFGEVLSKHY